MTSTGLPMLRTSERMTFKRCRQKWYWSAVMGLRPRDGGMRPALVFGDLTHQSLAAWYRPGLKRGPKPHRTFEKLYMALIDEYGKMKIRDLESEGDERFDLGELGITVLKNYVEHYGDDEDIRIIHPEFPFMVRMKDAGGKPFYYVGRMDALFEWAKTVERGLLEHKTGSEQRKKNLPLDEQGGSYWTFAPMFLRHLGIMAPDEDLDMILYNFMRKVKGDDRPKNAEGQSLNKDGTVSKRQPPPQFERIPVYRSEDDRKTLRNRVRQEQFEMRLARAGKLPIYKNPTDDCSWDCIYRDMCELHETRSDYLGYMDQMFVRINPYDEYERDLLEGGEKWQRLALSSPPRRSRAGQGPSSN